MIVWLSLLLVGLHGATSQLPCVPEAVEEISLSRDFILRWKESEKCGKATYKITAVNGFGGPGATRSWDSVDPFVDISSLGKCEFFYFRVVAIVNDVEGISPSIPAQVPAPPETNITVTQIQVNSIFGDYVQLEWDINDEYALCLHEYRVSWWDYVNEPQSEHTVFKNFAIQQATPCSLYEYAVTPLYNFDVQGVSGIITYEVPAVVPPTPSLVSVRSGTTFVDTVWQLAPYESNRCTISSFIFDGSPYASVTIPVTDSLARPSIPVHVEGLQPDRFYVFRVSVVSSAGVSKVTTIGIQTQPAV